MHHRSHDQGVCIHGGLHPGKSACNGGLHPGGSVSGGSVSRVIEQTPHELHGILRDAVNKWAVRILVLFEIKIKRCKIYT